MERYVTLGADENGEVYGLELGEDGKRERNSLGLSTSCAVIRPLSKENYEYLNETINYMLGKSETLKVRG